MHNSQPLLFATTQVYTLLGMCQIDKDNSYEQRSVKCIGFGEAINVTLEPKP